MEGGRKKRRKGLDIDRVDGKKGCQGHYCEERFLREGLEDRRALKVRWGVRTVCLGWGGR